ncbi:hypothetical protein [Hanstruepera neustonica]|nr:hypothetical protein [Hanstruepera neustonica]
MLKKAIFYIPILLMGLSGFCQNDINNYKYVIVPKTFDFLKSEDQFQLNSLSKFMFEKYGFVALFDDEPLPDDLIKNGCLALNADVIKDSGMFKTKLFIELKNCRKQLVFQSQTGDSDHKKSEVAYKMAIREAFESFDTLNYTYKPASSERMTVEKPKEVKSLPSSSVELATPANQVTSDDEAIQILYAKSIGNGYQLMDSNSEIVYTLIFSGKEDLYIVKGKDATVYKVDGKWVIAETVDDVLHVTTLNITFQ